MSLNGHVYLLPITSLSQCTGLDWMPRQISIHPRNNTSTLFPSPAPAIKLISSSAKANENGLTKKRGNPSQLTGRWLGVFCTAAQPTPGEFCTWMNERAIGWTELNWIGCMGGGLQLVLKGVDRWLSLKAANGSGRGAPSSQQTLIFYSVQSPSAFVSGILTSPSVTSTFRILG